MNKNIIIALLIVSLAQVVTFFQMQGQFFNEWMRKNTYIVILLGIPISWLFIKYAKYANYANHANNTNYINYMHNCRFISLRVLDLQITCGRTRGR